VFREKRIYKIVYIENRNFIIYAFAIKITTATNIVSCIINVRARWFIIVRSWRNQMLTLCMPLPIISLGIVAEVNFYLNVDFQLVNNIVIRPYVMYLHSVLWDSSIKKYHTLMSQVIWGVTIGHRLTDINRIVRFVMPKEKKENIQWSQ